jgi:hypothetical protein
MYSDVHFNGALVQVVKVVAIRSDHTQQMLDPYGLGAGQLQSGSGLVRAITNHDLDRLTVLLARLNRSDGRRITGLRMVEEVLVLRSESVFHAAESSVDVAIDAERLAPR